MSRPGATFVSTLPDQTIPQEARPPETTFSAGAANDPAPSRSQVITAWLTVHPLVCPAIGLIAGIWIDAMLPVPAWLACTMFALAGGAVWLFIARQREAWWLGAVSLIVAGAAVGALLHDTAMRRWPAEHIVRYVRRDPPPVRLVGTVVTTPQTRERNAGAVWFPELPSTRFVVQADHFVTREEPVPVAGLVSVIVREPALAVGAGDRIDLHGRLRHVAPPSNPGSNDWRLAKRRNGILVEMSCRRADDVRVLAPEASRWLAGLTRARLRARSAMLDNTYSPDVPGSGFLSAMILGQRSEIDPALNEAFIRSGTVHYLSVSGAHVGMLVGTVWGAGLLLGAGRRRCAAVAMVLATAYAVLAEPSPPIVRAAIMTDLACVALLLRRPLRVANWLALSALILLVMQPTNLFNAGFQLSYVTLLTIIYVPPRIHEAAGRWYRKIIPARDPLLSPEIQQRIGMQPPPHRWTAALSHLGWLFSVSISAWAVGGLLATHHFHQFQLWGWLNTVVLVPLIWLVMMLGLIKTVLAAFVPLLAKLLGYPLVILTDLLIGLVEAMAALPGSGVATPAVSATVVAIGLLAIATWTLRPYLRWSADATRMGLLVSAIVLAWATAPRGPSNSFTLHALSVGSGTAVVIELPDGKTLLYDIGSFPPYDLERWTVGPLLARDHCARIDAVLLSHANLDHYGGMFDLLARRSVRAVVTTPHFEHAALERSTSRRLIDTFRQDGLRWHILSAGDRLTATGEVDFDILWPIEAEIAPADSNDTSMVVRMSCRGIRILLTGDIEEYAMGHLLASSDLRADVLLLPHHGSVESNTAAFIRAVDPAFCIRSTGRRDTSEELLDALGGRAYFSTAVHGAVKVTVDGEGLHVEPFVPPR